MKIPLSYDLIKQKYSQIDILNLIYPELKEGKNNSPLRKDKIPSFLINFNENGTIGWKDMRTGEKGNLYELIRKKEKENFKGILKIINKALKNSGHIGKNNVLKEYKKENKSNFTLDAHIIPFNKDGIAYWKKYELDENYLIYYDVHQVNWIYLNYNTVNEYAFYSDLAFLYKEHKDGKHFRKTYQPYRKKSKWYSNALGNEVWEGWNQIKNESDLFIFQKALKDTMCIQKHTPYASANMGSESTLPKIHVFNNLLHKNKLVLADNDYDKEENWGLIMGKKLSEHCKIPLIYIPKKFESKNYSDAVEKYGIQEANKILNSIL